MKAVPLFIYFLIIFLSAIFSSGSIRSQLESDKSNPSIIILTESAFIDSYFKNVIPFIEPSGLDHYSYFPSQIPSLKKLIREIYGYDLNNKLSESDSCYHYQRSGSINSCLVKPFWISLSLDEWRHISEKFEIYNLVTTFPINNLKECKLISFENPTTMERYKYYHYQLPSKPNHLKEELCPNLELV